MQSVARVLALLAALVVVSISGYVLRPSGNDEADLIAAKLKPLLQNPDIQKALKRAYAEGQDEQEQKRLALFSENELEDSAASADKRGRPMPPLPWDKRSEIANNMYRQARGRAMPPLPWDKREDHRQFDITNNDDDLTELQEELNAKRLARQNIV